MARTSTTRKEKRLCALCVLPLSSEQCKDACEYQEKGHHSGDNKQQEFAEEVWFHQLISPHGTTSNLHCRSSLNWPENLNSRPSMLANGRCREPGSLDSHGD